MLDIRMLIIACVASLALGATSSWWLTAEYKDNKWIAKVEAQKVEAARQLQEATEKVIELERQRNQIATKLEIQNAAKQTELDKALSDNRRLATQLGGLRDPGRRQSCPTALPNATNSTQQPADSSSDARLSAEATEFLLEFAREADRAAQYAGTCYQWLQQVR